MLIPKWSSRSGVTMVELLTAVLIVGVSVFVFSSQLTNSRRLTQKVVVADDLVSTRQNIRARASCEKTLTGVTCGSILPLKNRTGAVIGTPSFGAWKFSGDHHIRATCDGVKLTIEVARLASATTFKRSPTNPAALDSWKPLFPAGELDCKEFYAKSTCTGPSCGSGLYKATRTAKSIVVPAALGAVSPVVPCSSLRQPLPPGMTTNHYNGNAICPTGYVVASGGGNCQVPPMEAQPYQAWQ